MQNRHDDAPETRAKAGKALLIFLGVMAALTMLSNTLQEMVLPLVTPTLAQRGALEQQVNASGTLRASNTLPVVLPEAARATEILVKAGARVKAGDALMRVDYSDVLKERHKALIDALNTASQREQAYLWAKSDLDSKSKEKTVEKRRSELEAAENALAEARQALLAAIEAQKADGADAKAVSAAERAVKTAQSNVTSKRNRLGSLTKSREFITASSDLAVAQEALNACRRAFFDVCAQLDDPDVDCADEERIIQVALAQIGFGGGSTDQLPLDSHKAYTGTVRAPADGEMISIDVKAGEMIPTDKPAMTVGDLRQGFSLIVTVAEAEAELMAVGDRAEISVGDERLTCNIASIRVSDEQDQYEVEFNIPEGYGSVGLRGAMSYKKRTQNYDLLIPLGALRQDNEGDFVYLVQQQEGSLGESMSVVRVPVYVLEKDNTRAALQGGVTQRDILALRSDREIADGDRVRLEE